ncbi:MAG: PHP domain-containing protein [Calditrichaeota bacterium]|nr:MAG: PHP domain-containing protein [Calditrichota bacterium]
MKKNLILILFMLLPALCFPQNNNIDKIRQIIFPNIPDFFTLKCDLHQHTAFSDGHVWPTIRVTEALKDNLDAIAVTEHIEYQPHEHDIPHPDRNRAYEIALKAAKDKIIIIPGSEITRDMPPGHANAIFLQDVNKLLVDDPVDAFREAKEQGAFIFWNHPNWTSQRKDGIATLTDMHHMLIKEGLLQGIEVVNEFTYSDEALQIALDNDLTIMGTSDIHGIIDWEYNVPAGGHRPITLVFATEKSAAAIQEGLEQKRTVVWFNNLLIGRSEFLLPLLNACVHIKNAKYQNKRIILNVELENKSSTEFLLKNESKYTFHNSANVIKLKPHSTKKLEIKTVEIKDHITLEFSVLSAVNAPNTHPKIQYKINTSSTD